ncbi:MAG: MBL fold metallo-hydrolase [Opitutaceae bacterium]|nr:MBL fold metallo-hydrolase [Cytophagales bacterium]
MNVRLKFLGGAQTVTGSRYLLEIDNYKILVDCGLFQGLKDLRLRNWEPFPVDPKTISAVIITHAHIDHTGYLPKLFKEGFNGPVYCTVATKDLMNILLLDSAKLQEEEAEWAFKKGYSKHSKPMPLYTVEDVNGILNHFKGFAYHETIAINKDVSIRYYDAGHILGSAITEVSIRGEKMRKTVVFSGDIGRYNKPILRNPTTFKSADILLIESTYGNKDNPGENAKEKLAELINTALARKGCLMIPAFSVGRTQLLIYYVKLLMDEKLIPNVPIFIDSPMSINVTAIYKRHSTFHKLRKSLDGKTDSIFDFPNLHYYRSQSESIAINNIKSNAIIISSSGMCNGGRILHHLYNRLERENDTILIVGYQAEGTRGRKILDGEKKVRIFGEEKEVKCQVVHINALSAHADKSELMRWLKNFKIAPKNTFITHGETDVANAFAQNITNTFGWNVTVPDYLETFELFKGI